METTVNKTPMAIIAGILAIVSGGFKLLGLLGLIIASFFVIASPVTAGACAPSDNGAFQAVTHPLSFLS